MADFASYLSTLTSALDKLSTAVSSLPPKSDLNFQRTMDRGLAQNLDEASEKVLKMTEGLLNHVDVAQEEAKGKGKGKAKAVKGGARIKLTDEEDATEGYRRSVTGVVNGLLEDAVSSNRRTSLLTHRIFALTN